MYYHYGKWNCWDGNLSFVQRLSPFQKGCPLFRGCPLSLSPFQRVRYQVYFSLSPCINCMYTQGCRKQFWSREAGGVG